MKDILFRELRRSIGKNTGAWILGLVGLIAFFFVLFWMLKGLFSILAFIAPVLLVITAIINYRVITGYVKMLWDVFNKNWMMGILGVILTVVGFPLISGFLFFQALVMRKVGSIQADIETKRKGEFVEYEDLSDEVPEKLILKQPEPKKQDRYDDLF